MPTKPHGYESRRPGVLRCAEFHDYEMWRSGRRVKPVPDRWVESPLQGFCRDAEETFCRDMRAIGRCMIQSRYEFERVQQLKRQTMLRDRF